MQKNCSGYLVSEALDGKLLTIVSYVKEFFPYNNSVSIHFFTPLKKNSFYSTKSTLITLFLISNISGCKKIISRNTSGEIQTLMMLLSLNFQISELMSQSEQMVVLEKQFNTAFLNDIELDTSHKINKIYNSYKNNSSFKQINKNSILNLEQKITLNRWLGFKKSEEILELDTIKNKLTSQKQLLLVEIKSTLGKVYIFINKETNISLILIPLNLKNRAFLYKLYLKVSNISYIKTIYIQENNSFIRSIIHLAGFNYIGNIVVENDIHLHKWQKI